MITDSRFIIVAGTARNVGKTNLLCRIIKANSSKPIIGLKFITLKEGVFKHKHHSDISTYEIIQEKNLTSEKDTAKMLRAGAKQSYLIVARSEYIEKALVDFLSRLDSKTLVVAESATLRNYINPKLFIIVDREGAINRKSYIEALLPLANFRISDISDKIQVEKILEQVK